MRKRTLAIALTAALLGGVALAEEAKQPSGALAISRLEGKLAHGRGGGMMEGCRDMMGGGMMGDQGGGMMGGRGSEPNAQWRSRDRAR